ncbi:MAG: adenylate/guanylate cyclase domain-containing protein [Dehalococcoidia bacterium]|nr:adenylate/guanylate cyclase domain-containing protein [Dehalococcoidia bacterium]
MTAHEGSEAKSQGDGFMLAFQSARRALQCAAEIQRAFARRNESAEEPIRVRMGLHTGEAIKDGDDSSASTSTSPPASPDRQKAARYWPRRCSRN